MSRHPKPGATVTDTALDALERAIRVQTDHSRWETASAKKAIAQERQLSARRCSSLRGPLTRAYPFRRRVRAATDVPAATPPTTVSLGGSRSRWGIWLMLPPCRQLCVPGLPRPCGL